MIRAKTERVSEERHQMRGGEGTVTITHYCQAEEMKNCRILAEMTVPPGAGVGTHEHTGETEYYLIMEGSGIVNDNGTESRVAAGDVVITGGGATHAIRNDGSVPLRLVAVIITD